MAYPQINGFVSMLHVGISDKLDEWFISSYILDSLVMSGDKNIQDHHIHRLMHQIWLYNV